MPTPGIDNPKLRYIDAQWVSHKGSRYLRLQDRLGLSDNAFLVPQNIVQLLGLCDGTRDALQLQNGFALRTGLTLSIEQIQGFVADMEQALLLEGETFKQASASALNAYRKAPYRQASHTDIVYPSDIDALNSQISGFISEINRPDESETSNSKLVAMVCPHIDYERGGKSYAQLFERSRPDLVGIETIVIFGTDHSGAAGALTPTRQNYMTPHGIIPTDLEIVEGLAKTIGEKRAFAEELHHAREHSIELALVWLNHYLDRREISLVPILCGSFHPFVSEGKDVNNDETISATIEYLRKATADRRTLVVAAGDLAHIGPAFGDQKPISPVDKTLLANKDAKSIQAICSGDAESFLSLSRSESDARRICGLSAIYMALKLTDSSYGLSTGYAQCPADQFNSSWVSIVGALLYDKF